MSFGFSACYNVEGLSCGGRKQAKIPATQRTFRWDFARISNLTYAKTGDSQPHLTQN
jgi:hypothetical protein